MGIEMNIIVNKAVIYAFSLKLA